MGPLRLGRSMSWRAPWPGPTPGSTIRRLRSRLTSVYQDPHRQSVGRHPRGGLAEAAYNGEAISIEHEGHAGDVAPPAQADADVEWCAGPRAKGLPADRAHRFGHGELGVAGGNYPDRPGENLMAVPPVGAGPGHHRPQPSPSTSGTDQGAGNERHRHQRSPQGLRRQPGLSHAGVLISRIYL